MAAHMGLKSSLTFTFASLLLLVGFVQSQILTISPRDGPVKNGEEKSYLRWPSGQTLNLTCKVDDDDDVDYTLNWYLPREGRPIRKDQAKNRYTIILENVTTVDTGRYSCTGARATGMSYEFGGVPTLKKVLVLKVKSSASQCGASFFRCSDNVHHCIGQRYVCDGVPDCQDGSDELHGICGLDVCKGKLRCGDEGRCMDPVLCCDPHLDSNCTVVPSCCLPLLESNRYFYQMGIERSNKQDMTFLHSTVYTIIGCVGAFVVILLLVTLTVCRLHAKEGWLFRYGLAGRNPGTRRQGPRGGGRAHPPITLHDLDVYFASLRRVESHHSVSNNPSGITYNINNGVQIVGAPPPYSLGPHGPVEPPPPYSDAVVEAPQQNHVEVVPLLLDEDDGDNNNEGNNNGDINGNSDMVDQHRQRQQEEEQQQQQQQRSRRRAQVSVTPSSVRRPVVMQMGRGGSMSALHNVATRPMVSSSRSMVLAAANNSPRHHHQYDSTSSDDSEA